MVGSVTGMNKQGLCAMINEAGHTYHQGKIPYTILQREVLEKCKTVTEAEEFIKANHPIGSHLLMLSDQSEAKLFQFYPEKGKSMTEQFFNSQGFLVATNHFVNEEGLGVQGSEYAQDTYERKCTISEHIRANIAKDSDRIIHESLVRAQNCATMQTILMDPQKRELKISWSEGFSASVPMKTLHARDWIF